MNNNVHPELIVYIDGDVWPIGNNIDRSRVDVRHVDDNIVLDTNRIVPARKSLYINGMHGLTKPNAKLQLANVPTITMSRNSEIHNIINLINNGINTPRIFYAHDILYLIGLLEDDKKYLIKSLYSARSIGQSFVTIKDIVNMREDIINGINKEDFNKKYIKDAGQHNGIEHDIFSIYDKFSSALYISEIVEFTIEYRILLFKSSNNDGYIVEERHGYQIESEEERRHFVVDNSVIPEYVITKLYSLFNKNDLPAMSFDIYVNGTFDNEWGVFECSEEYGTYYPDDTKRVMRYMTDALLYMHNKLSAK